MDDLDEWRRKADADIAAVQRKSMATAEMTEHVFVSQENLETVLDQVLEHIRKYVDVRDQRIDELEKRNRELETRCRTTEARLAAAEKRLTDGDAVQNANRKHFDAVEKKIGELARGRNGNVA
jgi:hypothetical protein